MALSERTQSPKIERRTSSILIFDVERVEGRAEVRFWDRGQFKGSWFPSDAVLSPPRIICWGARWYGSDKILTGAEWRKGGHERMIRQLWELVERADVVVGHNVDRADLPWLRESLPQYGIPLPRPAKSVDTYKVMRQQFPAWHSKSLTEAAKFLNVPLGKEGKWSRDLADAAVAGDRDAQRELLTYQKGDIVLSGAVYDGMRGYIPNHPFITTDGDERVCNQCGSLDLAHNGEVRAVVMDYAAYRCNNCGGNLRAGYVKRAALSRGIR
ncbi:hypothetical protein GCM10028801_31040 [Nocardioides maradonensis]